MNPHRSLFTSPIPAWLNSASLVRTALIVSLLASAANVKAQSWSATGPLVTGRFFGHTATLLANGKVLVVGGTLAYPYAPTSAAELYDPATGQWSVTTSLSTPRSLHTAVRLANGKVLVAGGFSESDLWRGATTLNSAEIYDPDSGVWSAAGNLSVARARHTATLLADGKVLVTGGGSGDLFAGLDTAEMYDPATGAWSPAGTMSSPRSLHTATLLADGRVLVVGGIHRGKFFYYEAARSTDLYDPAIGSWTATGDPTTPRVLHTATLLRNGKVLAVGGEHDVYPFDHYGNGIDKAELYDPATEQWSATGSLAAPSIFDTATLLPNGRVLVAGGAAELYASATGSWSVTGNSNMGDSHTATLLANGRVLVAGGGGSPTFTSAVLYDPGFETPLLTLNSTTYCIGDPWTLMAIHSARGASVRLLGVSNGASWEIVEWGATDQDGSFSTGGTIADGTEGTHSLSVEIDGIRSTPFSFAVSKCKP